MFNLTINAVPASTIIVGRRATWLDRHAAEELRDYVKKISGTILNIADETLTMAVTGNRILIGRPSTSDLVKNFADQNPGILPAESDTENDCLAIVQRGEVLVLSGSNDRSVYYSVCHLLQTVFHVGFYWDRDVYEANPDMTVPDNLTIVERSAFKFRHTIGQWVYNHGAFLNEAERREELDKYARNKINSYRLYSWNSYARKMTFIKLGVPGIEIKPEDIARRDIIRDTIEYAQALGIDIMVTLPPDEMTQDFHKLYPNARYFGSEWVKDDNAAPQTKPCLYPEDPMFKTFFQTFVKVWIEEYGPVHNFVASPPCESHISTTIDDYINISVNYSKYTYEAVHELVPEARVFFDGWGVRANTPPCIWTMPGVMQRFVDSMPDEVYIQRLHQAAHIPVQVAHHGVIPGQLPLGLLLDPGHIWHIGPQFNIFCTQSFGKLFRCQRRVVRREHAEYRKERPVHVPDQFIRQCVSFKAGQAGAVAVGTMHVTVPGFVIVLVPQPIVKASAVLRLDNVEYFTVGADGRSRALGIHVPFAKIGGVVTGIVQHMGDSLLLRRQAFIMPRRAVVGVKPGQHAAAVEAAQRVAGYRRRKVDPTHGQLVNIGGADVGFSVAAQRLGAQLVRQHPDHVGALWHGRFLFFRRVVGGDHGWFPPLLLLQCLSRGGIQRSRTGAGGGQLVFLAAFHRFQ